MKQPVETNYLECTRSLFQYYKNLGERAMEQVDANQVNKRFSDQGNSIAVIVGHLSGNMLSRFTDFLTADGEKEWRQRDAEFETKFEDKASMLAAWTKGWDCVFQALDSIADADLQRIVYIRNEGHTVLEALQRQLAHYAYHIGQLVFVARELAGSDWTSLTIPKNQSDSFNQEKFAKEKSQTFFTDGNK
jgi:hypothetical protein